MVLLTLSFVEDVLFDPVDNSRKKEWILDANGWTQSVELEYSPKI